MGIWSIDRDLCVRQFVVCVTCLFYLSVNLLAVPLLQPFACRHVLRIFEERTRHRLILPLEGEECKKMGRGPVRSWCPRSLVLELESISWLVLMYDRQRCVLCSTHRALASSVVKQKQIEKHLESSRLAEYAGAYRER